MTGYRYYARCRAQILFWPKYQVVMDHEDDACHTVTILFTSYHATFEDACKQMDAPIPIQGNGVRWGSRVSETWLDHVKCWIYKTRLDYYYDSPEEAQQAIAETLREVKLPLEES